MNRIATLALTVALFCTGCSGEKSDVGSVTDSTSQTTTVDDIIEQTQEEPTPTPSPQVSKAPIPSGFGTYEGVDIDLTTMSSTMVYTQVYDMVTNPDGYYGQTVKMHGEFGFYYEPTMSVNYFGIVVQDATACCAQGIEFVLKDEADRIFPDDYPEVGTPTTVVGIFQAYMPPDDPEMDYYHLVEAEFITAES